MVLKISRVSIVFLSYSIVNVMAALSHTHNGITDTRILTASDEPLTCVIDKVARRLATSPVAVTVTAL
jgi:hypothetical protein